MDDYEEVLKGLDRLAQRCYGAVFAAESLDDKLRMQHLLRELRDARSTLLMHYHDVEDMFTFDAKAEKCDKCGGLI